MSDSLRCEDIHHRNGPYQCPHILLTDPLVQRITRYPLLLRQILHYTGEDQDFQSIHNALNEAENIVGAINESVREAEGAERLRVLSEDLWIGGEG